jgi:sialate O-acetylesterase
MPGTKFLVCPTEKHDQRLDEGDDRLWIEEIIMKSNLTTVFLALMLFFAATAHATELRLHALFSNGAVLQRDIPLPVWGWTEPGQGVEVEFAGQTHTATADANGKWKVTLTALATSAEGRQLVVRSGLEELTVDDLVVGDVWFCSGQSNMGMTLGACSSPSTEELQPVTDWMLAEKDSADDPLLRTIKVPVLPSFDRPITDIGGAVWLKSNPVDNGKFSGVAYFFGRELRREVGVPVGVIHCAKIGTQVEAWMPPEAFYGDADMEAYYEGYLLQYETDVAAYDPASGDMHPREYDKLPSSLYNGMVNAVVPYGIRGAIWYQGEKNASHNTGKYGRNLWALIQGWRTRWDQGAFPFYFVQLANLGDADVFAGNGEVKDWVLVQDMQRLALTVENTGMAIINDVGESTNIHPKNKLDVGKRLALWALKNDYGQELTAWCGPVYQGNEIRDGKMRITFSHTGSGLMTARKYLLDPAEPVDEALSGFEVKTGDEGWVPAQATILPDNTVEVWSEGSMDIQQARYAFMQNPASANLYNTEGLPASCFTTDAFEIPYPGDPWPCHSVYAVAGANGSVKPVGEVIVPEQNGQSFSISADAGYIIEDVLVDGVSVGAVSSYSFTDVATNHTLTASFIEGSYYSIDAAAGSNGSIDPAGDLSIPEGGGQSFTITADSGYAIQDVLVDGTSVGAVSSYSFTDVTTNHTLTASFVKIPVAGDPVPVSITNEMGDFPQRFFRIIEE